MELDGAPIAYAVWDNADGSLGSSPMAFRLPIILAGVVFLSSGVAAAASVPTTTDEARAAAARRLPDVGSSSFAHAAVSSPTNTDEARGISVRAIPVASPEDVKIAAPNASGACDRG
jgi:hypothetical protein